ncbi:PREDICTED: protein TSSC1-like [Priapulus caudatus]|uniref:Protein TSSC1-like n=1 Tax=Priapulus caudatus TaxID=37621 RepID=A0ABM1EPT1_PRICU|nr:PREDICTED: protein TSSC1-like [Priapulus caudatus]
MLVQLFHNEKSLRHLHNNIMEDDAPVIYGLEFQARALTAQVAETDDIRFLVGTQSLKFDNQIHQIDFDDENNILNKNVFAHKDGEIWHISASPVDKNILATCFNNVSDTKCEMAAALWRIPAEFDVGLDDTSSSSHSLQLLCRLEHDSYSNMFSVLWQPNGEGDKVITMGEGRFLTWDLNASGTQATMTGVASLEAKGQPKFTAGRWNPHSNATQIATANDTSIRLWDLRSMEQVSNIDVAHMQCVRNLDFNPNKQYYLASCGDDCKTKFWDTRKTDEPLLVLSDHSHWVWSVRFNHFHDQLVLTSSSDSRVILTSVASISSEPLGHLVEGEESDDDDQDDSSRDGQKRAPQTNGVLASYEEHEDSVYAAEWSTADPWLFASLSYDGRVVINRVPRAEKYKILL